MANCYLSLGRWSSVLLLCNPQVSLKAQSLKIHSCSLERDQGSWFFLPLKQERRPIRSKSECEPCSNKNEWNDTRISAFYCFHVESIKYFFISVLHTGANFIICQMIEWVNDCTVICAPHLWFLNICNMKVKDI